MSNLLEKSSLVLTPTAYENGKILSVKPAPSLGSELITNGDFATDSDWGKINATISGGTGNLNGTGVTSMLFQDILTNGKTYRVTFTVSDYNSLGNNDIINANGVSLYVLNSNGTFTFTFTHNIANGNIYWRARNGGIFSIDNISVKQEIDGDFQFTRNSSATRVNSQGLIEDITSNLPRIDYTGGVGHWLFEPQRTNLLDYSNDFSQSYWTKQSGVTATYNTTETLSPDGTYNATKFVGNGTTGVFKTSISVSGVVSRSFYLKSVTGTTTAVFKEPNTNVPSPITLTITNEWQRFEMIGDNGSSFQGLQIDDITSDGLFMWGAQLEAGSFPTSYIPTNGEVNGVTRLQDAAFGAGSSDLINSTEGVLYAEIAALANENVQRISSISDGTANNTIQLGFLNSATNYKFFASVRVGGAFQAFMVYDFGAVQPTFKKVAVKYKQNDFALWIDGIKVVTDTSGNVPTGLNKLSFDRGDGGQDFFGKTKCLAVFKEALTDAELTCLTTI